MVWPVPVMAVVEVSARLALNLNTAQVVVVVDGGGRGGGERFGKEWFFGVESRFGLMTSSSKKPPAILIGRPVLVVCGAYSSWNESSVPLWW